MITLLRLLRARIQQRIINCNFPVKYFKLAKYKRKTGVYCTSKKHIFLYE